VFLTPRVVRDPAEAKRLKEESQSDVSPEMQRILKEQLKRQAIGTKTGG
jgi:type II secretory pathway component GspD/PulD (secretin)